MDPTARTHDRTHENSRFVTWLESLPVFIGFPIMIALWPLARLINFIRRHKK